MMNANRIARGQIWHWTDPLYGDKQNATGDNISGENTIRYSRYVLVVQDEPRCDSVLCVPLSTKSSKNTDYRTPVYHPVYKEQFSYMKIDRVFNVFPDQLDEYICTVDADTMKLVEAELIRLLCPTVYKSSAIGEMLISEGLPMDQVSEDHWQDEEAKPGIYTIVGKFIKKHIKTGANIQTPAYDVYSAYAAWCYENGYVPPEEERKFLDLFCTMLHLQKDKYGKYLNTTFKNVRIIDIDYPQTVVVKIPDPPAQTLAPAVTAPPVIETPQVEKKHSTKKKWDADARAKFMSFLASHSIKETAEKFGISENSVYKYRKLFTKLDTTPTMIEESEPEEVEVDSQDERINFAQAMKEVRECLSNVSNFIKNDMQANEVYAYTTKDPVARTSEFMDKAEFYQQISAGVYYSLMEFLEIKEGKTAKTFYHAAPATLIKSKAYLDILNISEWAKEGMSPYEIYKKIRADGTGGIDQKWLTYLQSQLAFRLSLTPENIDSIVGMIRNNYCSTK